MNQPKREPPALSGGGVGYETLHTELRNPGAVAHPDARRCNRREKKKKPKTKLLHSDGADVMGVLSEERLKGDPRHATFAFYSAFMNTMILLHSETTNPCLQAFCTAPSTAVRRPFHWILTARCSQIPLNVSFSLRHISLQRRCPGTSLCP